MRNVFTLCFFAWAGLSSAQDLVPIANDTGQSNWSRDQIQSVFLGERDNWTSGQPVQVVLPASQTSSFAKTAEWVLEAGAFEYQKYWLSLVFQGRAKPPVYVDNEADVIRYVQDHPGAIGLLHEESAPDALRLEMK